MKPSEILREAKALIDAPEKWCKDHCAIDEKGQEVPAESHAACQRCAIGAIEAVETRLGGLKSPEDWSCGTKARHCLRTSIPNDCEVANSAYIPDYNDADSTTHADVMAWFDRAIVKAEEGER